jgi:hypothetical protein
MNDSPEKIWPATVKLRDCQIYDDLGGSGVRIYTTAGNGYEKKEYTQTDIAQTLIEEKDERIEKLEAALTRQGVNMAFVLNRMDTRQWYDKFTLELAEDRAALKAKA